MRITAGVILMVDSDAKAVIEAALFAAGRTLTPKELADLSGISEERARAAADDLASEYASRGSGIEIKNIGEGYSMQVRFGLAGRVLSFAPKEIEAPLIRTIGDNRLQAAHQAERSGRDPGQQELRPCERLEKRGLINAVKQSRTKLLTTTRGFADYFGITSCNPAACSGEPSSRKRAGGRLAMFESLALRLGLDFIVVNPYKPDEVDRGRLKEIDLLSCRTRLHGAGSGELPGRGAGGQRSHALNLKQVQRRWSSLPAAGMSSPWRQRWTHC